MTYWCPVKGINDYPNNYLTHILVLHEDSVKIVLKGTIPFTRIDTTGFILGDRCTPIIVTFTPLTLTP